MRYESKKTYRGNVGVSYTSQEAADLQAAEMDNNCCSDCFNCSHCSGCSRCSGCSGCSGCSRCSGCSGCSRCFNCSDFKENPSRYVVAAIGSREATVTAYWVADRVRIVTGCFEGDLEEFLKAVERTHGDNKHGVAYKKFVKHVKILTNEEYYKP